MDQLEEEQREKLKQFTEITNIMDYDVAIGTLASLNWNVERAVEAHLMQEDGQDDPEIVEERPPPVQYMAQNDVRPSRNSRMRRRGPADEEVQNQIDDDDSVIPVENEDRNNENRRVTRSRARNGQQDALASSSNAVPASANGSAANRQSSRNRRAAYPMVVDSDDDEMRFDYDDDYAEVANEYNRSNNQNARGSSVPLVPDDCEDVEEGLRNFVTVFENRFCSKPPASAFMPPFSTDPLPQAIKEAFEKSDCSARRPLALYINNDRSIASNIFASQVLCTEAIWSLLRHQYVVWPWDVSNESNLRKLLEWLQVLNIGQVRELLQRITITSVEQFPMIVIVIRDRGTFRVVDVCRGMDSANQVIEKLMQGVDEYGSIRAIEAQEKRQREEREAIRNQQEAEYHASLEADKARIEAKKREIEEQRLEEERKAKAEEEEAMRRQLLASTLPSEPSETETDTVQVKFRMPEGNQEMRRFRKAEKIETLVNYLSSKGFAPELYKYFNSDFPKKEITSHFDLQKTFSDVKWPAREQVFVDEI